MAVGLDVRAFGFVHPDNPGERIEFGEAVLFPLSLFLKKTGENPLMGRVVKLDGVDFRVLLAATLDDCCEICVAVVKEAEGLEETIEIAKRAIERDPASFPLHTSYSREPGPTVGLIQDMHLTACDLICGPLELGDMGNAYADVSRARIEQSARIIGIEEAVDRLLNRYRGISDQVQQLKTMAVNMSNQAKSEERVISQEEKEAVIDEALRLGLRAGEAKRIFDYFLHRANERGVAV